MSSNEQKISEQSLVEYLPGALVACVGIASGIIIATEGSVANILGGVIVTGISTGVLTLLSKK